MSVQAEITRIETAKSDIANAIEEKGVSVPEGTKIDEMSSLIRSIETPTSEWVKFSNLPVLTQSEYDSLSTEEKEDPTKFYFIVEETA